MDENPIVVNYSSSSTFLFWDYEKVLGSLEKLTFVLNRFFKHGYIQLLIISLTWAKFLCAVHPWNKNGFPWIEEATGTC